MISTSTAQRHEYFFTMDVLGKEVNGKREVREVFDEDSQLCPVSNLVPKSSEERKGSK